jgi:hypothetical protein
MKKSQAKRLRVLKSKPCNKRRYYMGIKHCEVREIVHMWQYGCSDWTVKVGK